MPPLKPPTEASIRGETTWQTKSPGTIFFATGHTWGTFKLGSAKNGSGQGPRAFALMGRGAIPPSLPHPFPAKSTRGEEGFPSKPLRGPKPTREGCVPPPNVLVWVSTDWG